MAVDRRELDRAADAIDRALAFTAARDLDGYTRHILGHRARGPAGPRRLEGGPGPTWSGRWPGRTSPAAAWSARWRSAAPSWPGAATRGPATTSTWPPTAGTPPTRCSSWRPPRSPGPSTSGWPATWTRAAAEAKFAALAAARCRCEVVAIDYVPELMDRGRARAEAEHLSVKFRVADAEALPCDDGEYDAVLSVVGVMFAPNQEAAAGEIVRVCRPGGTIALASWTPDGFIGRLLKTVSRHVPPPPGVRPPVQWGAEERLRELFGDRITDLRTTRRDFVFRFTSAEDLADYFRANYGPTLKAFEAVGADGAKALHEDLVELANQHNSADDGTLKIRSGYLQALAYRA